MADLASSLSTTDIADGTDGTTAPSITTQIGGKDSNGNLQTLNTDVNGDLIVTSRVTLTASSPTTATVGITSAQALAANTSRRGLIITNVSINKVSFGIGSAAVLNSGITLYPGGTFNMDDFSYSTGAINAIASLAGSVISIQELI